MRGINASMRMWIILLVLGFNVAAARAELPRIENTGPIRVALPTRANQPYPLHAALSRPASDANWNRYAYGIPAYYYCGYGWGYGCGYHGCYGSGYWPYGVMWGYSIW